MRRFTVKGAHSLTRNNKNFLYRIRSEPWSITERKKLIYANEVACVCVFNYTYNLCVFTMSVVAVAFVAAAAAADLFVLFWKL